MLSNIIFGIRLSGIVDSNFFQYKCFPSQCNFFIPHEFLSPIFSCLSQQFLTPYLQMIDVPFLFLFVEMIWLLRVNNRLRLVFEVVFCKTAYFFFRELKCLLQLLMCVTVVKLIPVTWLIRYLLIFPFPMSVKPQIPQDDETLVKSSQKRPVIPKVVTWIDA